MYVTKTTNFQVLQILIFYFFFVSLNFEVYLFIVTVMLYTSDVFSLGPMMFMIESESFPISVDSDTPS